MSCKECEADIYPKEALLWKRSDKLPAPQTEYTPPGTASASSISLDTLTKKRNGRRGDKIKSKNINHIALQQQQEITPSSKKLRKFSLRSL